MTTLPRQTVIESGAYVQPKCCPRSQHREYTAGYHRSMSYSTETLTQRSVARYRRLGREREASALDSLRDQAPILRRLLGRGWLQKVVR